MNSFVSGDGTGTNGSCQAVNNFVVSGGNGSHVGRAMAVMLVGQWQRTWGKVSRASQWRQVGSASDQRFFTAFVGMQLRQARCMKRQSLKRILSPV